MLGKVLYTCPTSLLFMARSGNLVKGRENGSKGQFKVIAISGTPGTGKTRLAKELSLLRFLEVF